MELQTAIAEGADFIETDITATKDGKLICFHDLVLDHTTDVANHSEFHDRIRTYESEGELITGFFTGILHIEPDGIHCKTGLWSLFGNRNGDKINSLWTRGVHCIISLPRFPSRSLKHCDWCRGASPKKRSRLLVCLLFGLVVGAVDFTLEEVKTLRARQRFPFRDQTYNGKASPFNTNMSKELFWFEWLTWNCNSSILLCWSLLLSAWEDLVVCTSASFGCVEDINIAERSITIHQGRRGLVARKTLGAGFTVKISPRCRSWGRDEEFFLKHRKDSQRKTENGFLSSVLQESFRLSLLRSSSLLP